MMSEHEEAIWKLLWDYIAHPSPDEEYSYAMAERLCESVLPLVWNHVGKLEAENERLDASNKAIVAQADKVHERNLRYKADEKELTRAALSLLGLIDCVGGSWSLDDIGPDRKHLEELVDYPEAFDVLRQAHDD